MTIKQLLVQVLVLLFAGMVWGAETNTFKYDFTLTDTAGQKLGDGTIVLPFKFRADGGGMAKWTFAAAKDKSTNNFAERAKGLLAKGSGEARVDCQKGRLSINFNPRMADNNLFVGWDLKKESGEASVSDFIGGHTVGSFKIDEKIAP
jgi:hypothetical protein